MDVACFGEEGKRLGGGASFCRLCLACWAMGQEEKATVDNRPATNPTVWIVRLKKCAKM